ncbi:MAG: ATP-binding domain-containing protein [Ignavibacteriaceae bacterium]|nr:ATP-binding domain-containing protein [Ignavibacteriaceae bacterium]
MTANNTHNWSGITYEELTPAQKGFLMKVIQNPDKSFFLRGCAGSGKTVLASHALSILRKTQNKQAGLLVYTKLLKKFIQDGFGDNGVSADITHFHQWFYRGKTKKDIFLIDECQDFQPEWINAVITHSTSQIWLGDENQQLYNEDNQGPAFQALLSKFDESHIETLDINYRNSPFVARFAAKFIQLTEIDMARGLTIENKIENFMKPILKNTSKTSKAVNQPVVLIHGENKMREIDAMAEIIKSIRNNKQLQSKRIAIGHLRHDRLNAIESEFRKRGLNPYRVTKEKAELPDFSAPDTLIISPIHSLKGLEFDFVFFPWSEEDQWADMQTYNNLLFVLFTRAKSRVYCSFSNPANSLVYQVVKDDKDAEYYQMLPASDILKNGNPVKPEKDIDKIIKKHFEEFNV